MNVIEMSILCFSTAIFLIFRQRNNNNGKWKQFIVILNNFRTIYCLFKYLILQKVRWTLGFETKKYILISQCIPLLLLLLPLLKTFFFILLSFTCLFVCSLNAYSDGFKCLNGSFISKNKKKLNRK